MSFASSTSLQLSSGAGGAPVGGAQVPSHRSTRHARSMGTGPPTMGQDYSGGGGGGQSSAYPGGQSSGGGQTYVSPGAQAYVNAAGQVYANPSSQSRRRQRVRGGDQGHVATQSQGQTYGSPGAGQSYINQGQGQGQIYGSPDVDQSYGSPTQVYDPDIGSQNYGAQDQYQNYGTQGQYDNTYSSPATYQQYGGQVDPAYGTPEGDMGRSYGTAPGQTSSVLERSNLDYKPPGSGLDVTDQPLPASTIRTVSATALRLPADQLQKYRRRFDAIDLNKDGIVTVREFMAVSRVFGYKLTSAELSEIFGKKDLDESGGITFDEFVTAMEARKNKQQSMGSMRDKFHLFDTRSRGYLTAEDVQPILRRELGFSVNKTEAFVDLYDKNKDYRISLLEFADFYRAYENLRAQITAAFREFDTNQDTYIDIYELKSMLMPKGFTDEEVEALMSKYDKDDDNRLNHSEFADFWDVPIF